MSAETPSTCDTCRHWLPPGKRTGFGDAITLRRDHGVEGKVRDEQEKRQRDADMTYGECRTIDLVEDHDPAKPLPLAVTRDASEYMATLFTQATFGCVMHQSREPS